MARPCKSAATISRNLSKREINARLENEKILKGSSTLSVPDYLNERQKALFNFIVKELEKADILGGLDTYILETCVIAIDRLKEIETMINDNFDLILDSKVMSAKDKYTKDLYRCCNELSLSPQSRAKLANINLQSKKDEEDPLLSLIRSNS